MRSAIPFRPCRRLFWLTLHGPDQPVGRRVTQFAVTRRADNQQGPTLIVWSDLCVPLLFLANPFPVHASLAMKNIVVAIALAAAAATADANLIRPASGAKLHGGEAWALSGQRVFDHLAIQICARALRVLVEDELRLNGTAP